MSNPESQLMAAFARYDAKGSTVHRGHCNVCGWHGRALTDEGAAQFAAAKHWQRTGHVDTNVQTTSDSVRLPGSWN